MTNIKILKDNFYKTVEKHGYSIKDILPCIINTNNNIVTVNISHPSYPRPKNMTHEQFLESIKNKLNNTQASNIQQENQVIEDGAGTELKKLLKMIGITSTPNCSCNAKAKLMNQNGIQWCKDNIDTIVGWLKEEATKRNLPFFTYGAKKLVKLAISRAENAKTS